MSVQKATTIAILKDLIRINSINPFHIVKEDPEDPSTWRLKGNEQDIRVYLEALLQKNGFKVSRQLAHVDASGQKHYNILAEKGAGDRAILFYGHMDTASAVPWESVQEALTPREAKRNIDGEEKDIIIGLGANDMKAGLAVIANAFGAIEPQDYKIKIAFGVDEEFYSLGSHALIKSDFLADVSAIIVPEIGDGPNPTYGPRTIGLGRLGRCEYCITVFGTGGHGAQSDHPLFISAADECAKIVLKIAERKKTHVDQYTFVEDNTPGNAKMICGSFFVNRVEAGGGSLSIPAIGRVIVDWTFTPHFTIAQGQKYLEDMIEDMYAAGELRKVTIGGTFKKVHVARAKRPTVPSDAYGISADHPWVHYVQKVIDKQFGFANYNFGYSVADENVFYRACPHIPVLVVGPRGDHAHLAGEWVDVESVVHLEKLFQEIVAGASPFL